MNFKDILEDSKTTPILLEFWAPWCTICNTIKDDVDSFAEEISDKWKFVKIDASKNMDLANEADVFGLPTFMILKEGKILKSFSGNTFGEVCEVIRSLN